MALQKPAMMLHLPDSVCKLEGRRAGSPQHEAEFSEGNQRLINVFCHGPADSLDDRQRGNMNGGPRYTKSKTPGFELAVGFQDR